jgi:hypothetical protein
VIVASIALRLRTRPAARLMLNLQRSRYRSALASRSGFTQREHLAAPPTGHAVGRAVAKAVRKAPEMASNDRARVRAAERSQSVARPGQSDARWRRRGGPEAGRDSAGRARRKLKLSI